MARTPTVSDEDLLQHARAVFLDRGIRATTAEVAERAGVSEALLFKRFSSKDRMFQRAMEPVLEPNVMDWLIGLPERVGQGSVPDHLEVIGVAAIRSFETIVPLIMMSWSNAGALQGPELHHGPDTPPFESRRQIEAYFEAERRLGRIRRCDTEILARVFLGALFNYAFWELTLGPVDPRPLGPEAYVRGLVRSLWDGLDPAPHRHDASHR